MEDTIEICSGCGKMPRAIDHLSGSFICSRCGNRTTMHVNADNYEKVASELDTRFHQGIQKARVEAAASSPVEASPGKKAPARKPTRKAPAKKAGKPAKKARKR
jgi:hypothetical protein